MLEIFEASSVDLSTITVLLMLPVVATIVSIARHLIGLKSLGVFITIILTFAFYELGLIGGSYISYPLDGFKYGYVLLFITFVSATVTYGLIKNWALHYYPKLAVIITSVIGVITIILMTAAYFNITGIFKVEIFAVLLIALLSEKFMGLLARKSLQTTLFVTVETTVIASFAYIIISYPEFQTLILQSPYLLLLLFPINYLLGRFTGLRLREYTRFSDILDREE